jgi:hypothetical protein
MHYSILLTICTCFSSKYLYVSSEGTQSFLELQRKLAEEQWQRDQNGETQELDVEEEAEYYDYYYDEDTETVTSDFASEAAVPEDTHINHELLKRQSRGFKKPLSAGLTKDFIPYPLKELIDDAKGHSACLRDGEEDPKIIAYKVNCKLQ